MFLWNRDCGAQLSGSAAITSSARSCLRPLRNLWSRTRRKRSAKESRIGVRMHWNSSASLSVPPDGSDTVFQCQGLYPTGPQKSLLALASKEIPKRLREAMAIVPTRTIREQQNIIVGSHIIPATWVHGFTWKQWRAGLARDAAMFQRPCKHQPKQAPEAQAWILPVFVRKSESKPPRPRKELKQNGRREEEPAWKKEETLWSEVQQENHGTRYNFKPARLMHFHSAADSRFGTCGNDRQSRSLESCCWRLGRAASVSG